MRTTHVTAIALLSACATTFGGAIASAANSPATGSTPCIDAVGATCDPATEAAFQRWGANLALLAQADLGPYGDVAAYPDAVPALAALTACRLVSEHPDTTDGEKAWYETFMSELYPGSSLGDFNALFDASMQYVCPDLGYERGFVWSSLAGGERPTETLAVIVPGQPTWGFTGCEAALGVDPCATGGFAPLYERWGARLPLLYVDPDGDYEGVDFGSPYQDDELTSTELNMTALSLCYAMLTGRGGQAVGDWLDGQSARYPDADTEAHLLLFYYTMTRVCPDVPLPTG